MLHSLVENLLRAMEAKMNLSVVATNGEARHTRFDAMGAVVSALVRSIGDSKLHPRKD
jgi:hypothetical protein